MKQLLLLSTLMASGLFATPLVYNNNAWYNGTDPTLFGLKENFMIQSLTVDTAKGGTAGNFEAVLKYNFGNNSLAAYQLPTPYQNITISASDLFFVQNGTVAYGIPLITHGGTNAINGRNIGTKTVDAGDLFQIGNGITALTASALQPAVNPLPAGIYGPNRFVWLSNTSNTNTGIVAGTSGIAYRGSDCTAASCVTPEFTVTININSANSGAWATFLAGINNGSITPYFTGSTCGNDLLTGVPEPSTYALISGGLLLMGLRLRRKK